MTTTDISSHHPVSPGGRFFQVRSCHPGWRLDTPLPATAGGHALRAAHMTSPPHCSGRLLAPPTDQLRGHLSPHPRAPGDQAGGNSPLLLQMNTCHLGGSRSWAQPWGAPCGGALPLPPGSPMSQPARAAEK